MIIGGAGGMGRWFARFFKANGADVVIVDRSERTGEIATELGVNYRTADILKDAVDEIGDMDILLLSVPIDLTVKAIERVCPVMRRGSLIMDVTSVKKVPVEMMARYTAEEVEILGTHPLFGPSAKSMEGQTIIFVPERVNRLYKWVYELFVRSGAKIEILSAEEHDRLMSVLQGLSHFVLITLGITLKELNFDVGAARRFMSPMYEILIDFAGRILNQDPRLYALIQRNFEMEKIHRTYIGVATRLYEDIVTADIEGFIAEMEAARACLDTERAMRESEAVIEAKIALERARRHTSK